MEESVLETFKKEIKNQCELALIALEDLKKALEEYKRAHNENFEKAEEYKYILRIWLFVHAFLVAAANISKLLDPIKPQRPRDYPRKEWKIKGPALWKLMKERGYELRKNLSFDKSSPLIDRKARDYLEHFDAYFQEWIKSTNTGRRIDMSIGLLKLVEPKHPGLKDFLRYFDYEQYILVFGGEKFFLKRIEDAISVLLKKVKNKSSEG